MKRIIIKYNQTTKKWCDNHKNYDSFIKALFALSSSFDIIGWTCCTEDVATLNEIINQKKDFLPEMVTFGSHLFGDYTEYLESSNVYFNSFSKDEKETYDTWRIRGNSGYISSVVLEELKVYRFPKSYKTSLAILAYSASRIGSIVGVSYHKDLSKKEIKQLSQSEYVSFLSYVKKKRWLLYYTLAIFLFEKKITFPFFFFLKKNYQNYKTKSKIWDKLSNEKDKGGAKLVDIVIPTLGRPNYVYKTLEDIEKQDFKINKIHIIEQKLPNQKSTLLEKSISKKWSFSINHLLLERLGLCNARNVGVKESDANYIIMLDDDILIDFQPKMIDNLIHKLEISKSKIISFATNNTKGSVFLEMSYFISGGSFIVKNDNISPFNIQIEGMGSDDQEYNYSIHQKYQRVLYTNQEHVNHLRAPMGGWRFDAKNYLPWYKDNDIIPLPGPATLYRYLKFSTKNQLKGYKLFVFFKYYKIRLWKYRTFIKRWNKSLYWANKILENKAHFDSSEGIIKQ